MDTSAMYDDEVVADSEDEGASMELIMNDGATKLPAHTPDMITDTTLDTIIPAASTSSTSESRPRPKPRPIKKASAASSSSISPFTAQAIATPSSEIYMDTSSNIADRAKMRARNAKPVTPVDIIELSSDDEFHLTKPRQKAKAKPKKTTKSKVPKINSEFDDISTPDYQPRPRPKPIPKSNRPTKTSHPASPLGAITSQDINALPTSSIPDGPLPIPFRLLPSQLPPSDPPTSTASTYDHPPIETLPNPDTDIDVPSSPSSLFDVHSSGKGKRKRGMSHVDELDSEIDFDSRMMPPPALPGPPPTFFAGSSSPSTDISTNDPNNAVAEPVKNIGPPKKPRKKRDTEDEDGDGAAWGATKPKLKSKPKKSPQNKVEVVIERKSTGKTKRKGKDKEKEVFKSREFFDDEDEDDEMLGNLRNTTTTSTKPDSMTSLSSLPETDAEEPKAVGSSRKRKSAELGIGDKVGPSDEREPKKRAVGKGKAKQKAIVSEDEDDYAGNIDDIPLPSKPSSKAKGKGKGKKIIISDDENDDAVAEKPFRKFSSIKSGAKGKDGSKSKGTLDVGDDVEDNAIPGKDGEEEPALKENMQPVTALNPQTPASAKPASKPSESLFPSLSSRYTIAPKTKSTPMSELIRRVNSLPGSPFVSPAPRAPGSSARLSTPGTAYSPYLKSSRSALSRIAPLHPNRRTPPPPLPPPPPRPKTKKEREREEQWEEELVESVGGITEWACMTDAERKELRRAKREREMAGWED